MAWQQLDCADIHARVSWHMLIALSICRWLVVVIHVVWLRLRLKRWSVEYLTCRHWSGRAVLLRWPWIHCSALPILVMSLDVVCQCSIGAFLGRGESRLALNSLAYFMHNPGPACCRVCLSGPRFAVGPYMVALRTIVGVPMHLDVPLGDFEAPWQARDPVFKCRVFLRWLFESSSALSGFAQRVWSSLQLCHRLCRPLFVARSPREATRVHYALLRRHNVLTGHHIDAKPGAGSPHRAHIPTRVGLWSFTWIFVADLFAKTAQLLVEGSPARPYPWSISVVAHLQGIVKRADVSEKPMNHRV